MRPVACAVAGALVAVAAGLLPLAASASEALSEQHGCSNCHLAEKKLVGPAYRAVAERYRAQPDAAAQLAAKVAKGGSGAWGAVPMPGMAHVPADDVRSLVVWILAQPSK